MDTAQQNEKLIQVRITSDSLIAAARKTHAALRQPDRNLPTALFFLARVRYFADRLDLLLRETSQ